MTTSQLYEELQQRGYRNPDCETELVAARRVLGTGASRRGHQRKVDPGALERVVDRDLHDALELDRREVFRAWYGQKESSEGVPLWRHQLQEAERAYQAGRVPSAVHFLFSRH